MDRFYKECPGEIEPDQDTEEQKIIQDKGLEHERAFLGLLAAQGRRLCDLSGERDHVDSTLAAMHRGEEIIYQGYLECDDFAGYPDFLVRVESPSNLGAWSYEPWDTKLARHTKRISWYSSAAMPRCWNMLRGAAAALAGGLGGDRCRTNGAPHG